MLQIVLSNGKLAAVEGAYKTALPVILNYDPDFMRGVITSGPKSEYYTNFVDGSVEDARKLADALTAKRIPYQVACGSTDADSGKLWDALGEWALTLGE